MRFLARRLPSVRYQPFNDAIARRRFRMILEAEISGWRSIFLIFEPSIDKSPMRPFFAKDEREKRLL
jgi:hypothetical protein